MIGKAVTILSSVIEQARAARRTILYEHEVYALLHALEVATPRHLFVPRGTPVTEDHLSLLDTAELVIKVIGPRFLHRSKVGGIATAVADPTRVRSALDQMIERLGATTGGDDGAIDGFLLAQRVSSRLPGSAEILIGLRNTEAFGTVVVLGPGGVAVEELARNEALALAMAPLSDRDLETMLARAGRLGKGVASESESRAHEQLRRTLRRLGDFMLEIAASEEELHRSLADLELNPIVLDEQGNLWALDGLATLRHPIPAVADRTIHVSARPSGTPLDRLTHPHGVAVVGVSVTDSSKTGNLIAERLVACGRDDLFFVNPRGTTVRVGGREIPLYPTLTALPHPVDLAVVTVPAPQAPAVIDEAVAAGVGVVILIPGGFREAGGAAQLEARILESIRDTPTRVLGPNCMGLLTRSSRIELNTLFIPAHKLAVPDSCDVASDRLALVSQSGAATLSLLDHLQPAVTPRIVVSFGNQLDLEAAELLAHVARDPEVDVVGLYIEGFLPQGGRRLVQAVRESAADVLVYKAGRTAAGAAAAASHTASIAGDYSVARAALESGGAWVAEDLTEFADLLQMATLLRGRACRGRRVATVANAGFEATYAADQIQDLHPAALTASTERALSHVLPPLVGIHAFLDVTPMSDESVYEACVRALLVDPGVDLLLVSIVPHTARLRSTNDELEDPSSLEAALPRRLGELVRRHDTPMVVSINGGVQFDHFRRAMAREGIPTFPDARRAMRALAAWARYRLDSRSSR